MRKITLALIALAIGESFTGCPGCGFGSSSGPPPTLSAALDALVPVGRDTAPLVFERASGHFVFIAKGLGAPQPKPGKGLLAVGNIPFEAHIDSQSGAVELHRTGHPGVQLVPAASAIQTRPGQARGSGVIFTSASGNAAIVQQPFAQGVKEDIVLARSVGDRLTFTWDLVLGAGLSAKQNAHGDIDIADAQGIRYKIPAPIVRTQTGDVASVAQLSLAGSRLTLVADGLDRLSYPLSIDPTISIPDTASSSTFALGGNIEGGVDISKGTLVRGKTAAGTGSWSFVPMGFYRGGHATVASNGFFYVVGGGDLSFHADVSFAAINSAGTLGSFTTSSPFGTARRNPAAVIYNGYLYVIGGEDSNGTPLSDVSFAPVKTDGSLGSFSQTTSLTLASVITGRTEMGAVAANGFLYVAGGRTSSSPSSASNEILSASINADGTLGTFTSSTFPAAEARYGHVAVAYNGFVYLVGGKDSSGTKKDNVIYAAIGADGSIGANGTGAASAAKLSSARANFVAAAYDGYLYVVGGDSNNTAKNDVQYAQIHPNGSIGSFNTSANTMKLGREYFGGAVSNGELIVAGGYGVGGILESYEYVTLGGTAGIPGTFSTPSTMSNSGATSSPTARQGHCSVAYGGYLYVLGGSSSSTSPTAPPYLDDSYYAQINPDGTATNWQRTSYTLPSARTNFGCAVWNGKLYIAGGEASVGPLSDVWRSTIGVDGSLGYWTTTTGSLASKTARAPLIASGGYLYLLGGAASGATIAPTDQVELGAIDSNGDIAPFKISSIKLSSPRMFSAAAVSGDYVYVTGGADSNGTLTNTFQYATLASLTLSTTGKFSTATTALASRAGHTATVYDGYITVTGGRSSSSPLSDVQVAPLKSDGTPGTFVTATATLLGSSGSTLGRWGHTGVVANGLLYILGGCAGSGSCTAMADVSFATLNAAGSMGAFTGAGSIYQAQGLAMATSGNYVYALGGSSGPAAGPVSPRSEVYVATQSPDNSLAWKQSDNSLPAGRGDLAAAATATTLYVSGGAVDGKQSSDVLYASLGSSGQPSQFTPSTAGTFAARDRHCMATYGGYLYVLGGSVSGVDVNEVWIAKIDSSTGAPGAFSKSTASNKGSTRHSFGCTAYGGYLYAFGGASQSSTGASTPLSDSWFSKISSSDGSLGSWTATASLPWARSGFAYGVSGGLLYAAGGSDGSYVYADSAYASITSTGALTAWTPGPKLAQATSSDTGRVGTAGVAANGVFYVAGGASAILSPTYYSDVQYTSLAIPPVTGSYSRLIDLGSSAQSIDNLTISSSTSSQPPGSVRVRARSAASLSSTSFASPIDYPSGVGGPITLNAPMPVGTNSRYLWLDLLLDDSLTALPGPDDTPRDVTSVSVDYTKAPTKLAITSHAQTLLAHACSAAVTVATRDADGTQVPVAAATTLTLQPSGPGAMTFFTTAGCSAESGNSSPSMPAGTSSASFYFSSDTAGSYTINVSAPTSSGTQMSDQQTETIGAAAASKLIFTTQPQTTLPAGTLSNAVTVQTRDAYDNPSSAGALTLTLAVTGVSNFQFCPDIQCINPITTLAMAAADPSATFYFKGTAVGAPIISVSAPPVAQFIAQQTEGIVAGAAEHLSFKKQPPSSAVSGVDFQVIVEVQDHYNNAVSTTETVALSLNTPNTPGGGSISPSSPSASTSSGSVTFTESVDKAQSGYSLKATSGTLAPLNSSDFSITPGSASKLVFSSTLPSGSGAVVNGDLLPAPQVNIQDAAGNAIASGTNVNVTITASGPGTLSGLTTGSTSTSSVSFPGMKVNIPGDYTLTASSANTFGATSATFHVADVATHLGFAQNPVGQVAGQPIAEFLVALLGTQNSAVAGATDSLTVSIDTNPGQGTLSGAASSFSAGADGIVHFTGLSIDKAGIGYKLKIKSNSTLGSVTSSAFDITPGPPDHLAFQQGPVNVTAGVAFTNPISVSIQDVNNNVTSATDTITVAAQVGANALALFGNSATPIVNGQSTLGALNGVATFPGLNLQKASAGVTLTATREGLPPIPSAPFTVSEAAASQLIFSQQPQATLVSGTPFTVKVAAADPYLNPTPQKQGHITLMPLTEGLVITNNLLAERLVNGEATFADLQIAKSGSNLQVRASNEDTSLTFVDSDFFTVVPGAIDSLAFTTSPPPATTPVVAGANLGNVQVTAYDKAKNIATNATVSIGITLSGGVSGATLTGKASEPLTNGVATFADLSVDKLGQNYSLQATVLGISATSGTFNIALGPASMLTFTALPASTVAGVAMDEVDVAVTDSQHNTITGALPSDITLSGVPTLTGSLTAITSGGVARFTGLKITQAGGGVKFSAASSSPSFQGISPPFAVTPATPAILEFSQPPPPSMTAGALSAPPISVTIYDEFKNIATNSQDTVTLTVSDTSGNLLNTQVHGTSASSVSGTGVATFNNFNVTQAGIGYALKAKDGAITATAANTFTVTAADPVALAFTEQPTSIVAGRSITPTVKVAIQDANQNTVLTSSAKVTLTIAGSSFVPVTVQAINGVATFTNLTVTQATGPWQFAASSDNGLHAPLSSQFTVTAAAPTQLVFAKLPALVTAGAKFDPTVQVSAEDMYNNVSTTYTDTITLTAALSGLPAKVDQAQRPMVGGIAIFPDFNVRTSGSGGVLTATSAASLTGNSGTPQFTVNPAAYAGLAFTAQPTSGTAGEMLVAIVTLVDPFGNPTPTASANVTLGLKDGSALQGQFGAGTTNGAATFRNFFITRSAPDNVLVATADGLTPALTSPFAITFAAAKKLAFLVPPTDGAAGGGWDPPVKVGIEDAFGNVVTNDKHGILLKLSDGTNDLSNLLAGSRGHPADQGAALFQNLSVTTSGSGYLLSAEVTTLPALTKVTSDPFTIIIATASKLHFSSKPLTISVGACSATVTFNATDASNNQVPVTQDTTVTPSGTGLTFFSDVDCANAISAITVQGGNVGGTFHFVASAAGDVVLKIATSDSSLDAASQTEKVTGGLVPDGGTDAGTPDAGAIDGGSDAGTSDAGVDAGSNDGGTTDAGNSPDSGTTDAGTPDAATPGGNTTPTVDTGVNDEPPPNGWSCRSSGGSGGMLVCFAVFAFWALRRRRVGNIALLLILAAPAVRAAPRPKDNRPSIAVLNVDITVPGEKLDGDALTEILVNALDEPGQFRIVGTHDVVALLDLEKQKTLLGCTGDTSCVAEIAGAMGVDTVLHASVGKIGARYVVSAKLIDAKVARVLVRGSENVKDVNDVLDALRRVSQKIALGYQDLLGLTPKAVAKAAPAPAPAAPTTTPTTAGAAPVAVVEEPAPSGGVLLYGSALMGYAPSADPLRRKTVGGEAGLGYRAGGGFQLAVGAILGAVIGVRATIDYALTRSPIRLSVGVRACDWPASKLMGAGAQVGLEIPIGGTVGIATTAAAEGYLNDGHHSQTALLFGGGLTAHF